jgi:hypothetical protein
VSETAARTAQTTPKIEFIRVPDYQNIYTNNIQIAVSPFDVRMDIGDAQQDDTGIVKVTQKLQLVMSAEHARALLRVLDELLKKTGAAKADAPQDKRAD